MDKQIEIGYIARAILRNAGYYKGRELPTVQTTGTFTQIESHAKQLATNFYDKNFDVKTIKDKVYVDNSRFIEGVCELADKLVTERFGDKGYVDDGEGGTSYTEEAQDFFNEVYDETEAILNSVLKIHSEEDLN